MTKAEYMELLRKSLERFSKELQEEILEDYNQHFAEGADGMEANVDAKTGDAKISWRGERSRMSQGVYRYGDGSCKVNAKTHTGDIDIVGR